MQKTRDSCTETTAAAKPPSAFDSALEALAVCGKVLLRIDDPAPWAVAMGDGRRLGRLVGAPSQARTVAMHVVEQGRCDLTFEHRARVTLLAGDMVLCVDGMPHVVSVGDAIPAQPIEERMGTRPVPAYPRWSGTEHPEGTSLVCGVLTLRHPEFNPLLDSLPPLVQALRIGWDPSRSLSPLLTLLQRELDHPTQGCVVVTGRLLELLFAEILRVHGSAASAASAASADAGGW